MLKVCLFAACALAVAVTPAFAIIEWRSSSAPTIRRRGIRHCGSRTTMRPSSLTRCGGSAGSPTCACSSIRIPSIFSRRWRMSIERPTPPAVTRSSCSITRDTPMGSRSSARRATRDQRAACAVRADGRSNPGRHPRYVPRRCVDANERPVGRPAARSGRPPRRDDRRDRARGLERWAGERARDRRDARLVLHASPDRRSARRSRSQRRRPGHVAGGIRVREGANGARYGAARTGASASELRYQPARPPRHRAVLARSSASALEISAPRELLQVVYLATGLVIAEAPPSASRLHLAVAPGSYIVRRVDGGRVWAKQVAVAPGATIAVTETELELTGNRRSRSKASILSTIPRRRAADIASCKSPPVR